MILAGLGCGRTGRSCRGQGHPRDVVTPEPLGDLPRRPLTYSAALAAGLTRGELRSRRWRRLHRDVYVWAWLPEAHPSVRTQAASLLLPDGGVVGGWAAAWLHGARWLDGAGRPVPLVVPRPAQIRPRPGVVVQRGQLPPDDRATARGIPVTAPQRTCFDLLRGAELAEAVVAGDAMLHAGLVTAEAMRGYLAGRAGWPGVRQARRALDLCDPGAESPMETRLRLIWARDGRPRPTVNAAVFDRSGVFRGRPDPLDEDAGVAGEFDGAGHRDPDRHAADNRREHRLERAGLIVIRFCADDVLDHPNRVEAEISWAIQQGRKRDRSQDRWQTRISVGCSDVVLPC